jgi:hypothetical protein
MDNNPGKNLLLGRNEAQIYRIKLSQIKWDGDRWRRFLLNLLLNMD